MRQQHRARRPRRGQARVGGDRRFDQRCGGPLPLGRASAASCARAVACTRRCTSTCRPRRESPASSGAARSSRPRSPPGHPATALSRPLPGPAGRVHPSGEQQDQRDRLGRQERQQPQQARARGLWPAGTGPAPAWRPRPRDARPPRRGPAGRPAGRGIAAGTGPGGSRWPACTRRPAPGPAAARPARRPAPGPPPGPGRRSGSPGMRPRPRRQAPGRREPSPAASAGSGW